jgi:plasmid stability protein
MKNVTITLDDETHRAARIRAAELGTSLSALVKDYLQGLCEGQAPSGVREMAMTFKAEPMLPAFAAPKGDKPRKPGALRGLVGMADDFDETPDWLIDAFEGKDSHLPWPQ